MSRRQGLTYGLLADVVELVGCSIDDLALNLVGPAAIVSQAASAAGNIDVLGHAEGLAVVQCLDCSEEVGILLKELGEFHEKLSAVLGCLFSPWAVEGFACGGDGNVDILLGCLLDGTDNLLGGRVNDVEGLAVDRLYELVVDESGEPSVPYDKAMLAQSELPMDFEV